MRRAALTLLSALALGLAAPGASGLGVRAAQAGPPGCGAPAEAMEASVLPGTFAAIARGALVVLVVGSASSEAAGTAPTAARWPERLETVLRARLAPASVQVVVHGGRGTTAADHAQIIADQAPRLRPHLIVWQTGTVEATRSLPVQELSDAVQATVARLRATRGEQTDLVLMDPQFSRFLRANADVELYRDQMRMAAAATGTQLFSRWAIMKHWAETDRLDLERAPRERRAAVFGELHDCVARALAEFVLDGTVRHRR